MVKKSIYICVDRDSSPPYVCDVEDGESSRDLVEVLWPYHCIVMEISVELPEAVSYYLGKEADFVEELDAEVYARMLEVEELICLRPDEAEYRRG